MTRKAIIRQYEETHDVVLKVGPHILRRMSIAYLRSINTLLGVPQEKHEIMIQLSTHWPKKKAP